MPGQYSVLQDLIRTPLGLGKDEGNLQVPFNSSLPLARVYMINHSRTKKRQFVKIGVSERRGISAALLADKELQRIHNTETLRQSVKEGVDANVYSSKVEPVVYRVTHDGRPHMIEPSASAEEEPKPFLLPEGAWDFFMGNYQRMHGSPQDVAEESARLALSWMRRHSPIWKVTIDGETTTHEDNPFGYLEIVRLQEHEAPQQVDKSFLTALELAE